MCTITRVLLHVYYATCFMPRLRLRLKPRNLGHTLEFYFMHTEAEELGRQVVERHKRVLGEEHTYALVSMYNLALTHLDLRR